MAHNPLTCPSCRVRLIARGIVESRESLNAARAAFIDHGGEQACILATVVEFALCVAPLFAGPECNIEVELTPEQASALDAVAAEVRRKAEAATEPQRN